MRLFVTGLITIATTAAFLVIDSQAAESDIQELPSQVLKGALEKREDIRQEDRKALREIVLWVETEGGSVKYNDMSEKRRSDLMDQIRQVVRSFPAKEYDTPLQRQAKIQNLRMEVRVFSETPVFLVKDRKGVDSQIETFVESLMLKIRKSYPDIVGTKPESLIEKRLRGRLESTRDDDMLTVLKSPLASTKFTQLRESGENASLIVLNKDENGIGRVTHKWNKLDETERAEYLEKKSTLIANKIVATLDNCVAEICGVYGQDAIETVFAHLNKPLEISEKDVAFLRELNVKAGEERKLIREKIAKERLGQNEHERIMSKVDVQVGEGQMESVVSPEFVKLPERTVVEVESQGSSDTNVPSPSSESNEPNESSVVQDFDHTEANEVTSKGQDVEEKSAKMPLLPLLGAACVILLAAGVLALRRLSGGR